MLLQFWLGAILLLTIASVIFLVPFFVSKKAPQKNNNDNRNLLNRALYDVRLAELENDEQQGLLIDKEKIIVELQHNLLDDINDKNITPSKNNSKFIWLPGLFLLIFGSIAIYWSVGAYQEVNHWQNTLQRYPTLQAKLFNDFDVQPSEQDLRDIMLGLRTQLEIDPSDADGWLLYSRLGMVFKDATLALNAVKKAYSLDPTSVDIVLVYAQLKMQKGDEYSQQQAQLMLKKLLVNHPKELEAWSMYAFMALEKQDYVTAIARWQKMLTFENISVKQSNILIDSISYAKKQLAVETNQPISKPILSMASTEKEQQNTALDEISTPIYKVHISVADNVPIPDAGFIIVYAQRVSGPKMPLAAVKLVLGELPLSTTISDANVMMQGMKLSDHSEFVIKARLSKSGDVMNKKGDWEGVSSVIKSGQQATVNIVITDAL
ncbi:MAG: c-type cytochrome biogenesis protein CcmI [Psychromonas sp.]